MTWSPPKLQQNFRPSGPSLSQIGRGSSADLQRSRSQYDDRENVEDNTPIVEKGMSGDQPAANPRGPTLGRRTRPSEVTLLLQAHERGDDGAFDRLIELVYDDLRRIARSQLRKQSRKRAFATTALVNEAYVRLVEGSGLIGANKDHFLAIVARAMRFVLIDFARQQSSLKRGNQPEETLKDELVGNFGEEELTSVLAVHEALEHIQKKAPRLVQVVECRYFAGLSIEETAAALDVSTRTVERDWRLARAALYHSLGNPPV